MGEGQARGGQSGFSDQSKGGGANVMASDDLFAMSTASLSWERFIGMINQPAARDLVKDINLCVRGRSKNTPRLRWRDQIWA